MEFFIGYSADGVFHTKLFSGAVYDAYKIQIIAYVYDNDDAFSVYEIEQEIVVLPDISDLNTMINQLVSMDPNLHSNKVLNEGSLVSSIHTIQSVSSLLSEKSLSDKIGLSSIYFMFLQYLTLY